MLRLATIAEIRPSSGRRAEERRGPERREAEQCRGRLELAAVRALGAGGGSAVRHGGMGARVQRATPMGAARPLDAALPPLRLTAPSRAPPRACEGWAGRGPNPK